MSQKDQDKTIERIMARALTDETFKQRLLADATTALKEEGVAIPEGTKITVLQNSETAHYILLPSPQALRELDEDTLSAITAAGDGPLDKVFDFLGKIPGVKEVHDFLDRNFFR